MRRALLLACGFLGCEAPTEGLEDLGAPAPGTQCTGELRAGPLLHLPTPNRIDFGQERVALVSEGLYFAESSGNGGNLAVWTRTGEVKRLFEASPDARISVHGAFEQSVLWSRTVGVGDVPSEMFIAEPAGLSRTLGTSMAPLTRLGDGAPAPRVLEGSRATFYTSATIEILGGDSVYASLLQMTPSEEPYLRWPLLALTGYNSGSTERRIILYDLADSWRMLAELEGDLRNTIVTKDALVYLDGRQPHIAPLAAPGRPERLGDRPCSSIDTDGESLVLACDPEPSPTGDRWLAKNRTLWVFRDGLLTEIDLEGRTATLPRIRGDTIAYLAYDETEFCTDMGTGRVVVRDLAHRRSLELGTITHGCYCCGAFWPLPTLHLGDDLVAWGYDVTAPMALGWGMAPLTRACPEG